jgi:hypothetical protein
MTTKGFVVALDKNLSDEQIDLVTSAIRMLSGVVEVTPVGLAPGDAMIEMRARHDLHRKLLEVLFPIKERH